MGIQSETVMGNEIRVPGARIYPFAHVSRITERNGGVIWNRPAAVLVKDDNGNEEILMVQDVTRALQARILLFGLVGSILIWLIGRGISRS